MTRPTPQTKARRGPRELSPHRLHQPTFHNYFAPRQSVAAKNGQAANSSTFWPASSAKHRDTCPSHRRGNAAAGGSAIRGPHIKFTAAATQHDDHTTHGWAGDARHASLRAARQDALTRRMAPISHRAAVTSRVLTWQRRQRNDGQPGLLRGARVRGTDLTRNHHTRCSPTFFFSSHRKKWRQFKDSMRFEQWNRRR